MRTLPIPDPAFGDTRAADLIETIIVPRTRDLGGFSVGRVLPSAHRQMVGPFILLDQAGPADILLTEDFDVRPHPHIGLATVTYIHTGEIVHRDSIGSLQTITPGDVNWMTAGRGIAHSERAPAGTLQHRPPDRRVPDLGGAAENQEEAPPSFVHRGKDELPLISGEGASVRLAVGSLYGERAPVDTFTDMFFADVTSRRAPGCRSTPRTRSAPPSWSRAASRSAARSTRPDVSSSSVPARRRYWSPAATPR